MNDDYSVTGNMISAPLVSVAIITYNQKEYLAELLESVFQQSYPHMEVIVADDASTDGTAELCREYAARYPGKLIFETAEKNRGITENCNAAYSLCRGKYIAWMGGDDLMLPGKITAQVAFMESRPNCSICFHNVEVFDSISRKTLRLFNNWRTPRVGTLRTVLRDKTYNCACATMTRAESCPTTGFDSGIPVASDWKFWLETLSGGGEMHYIPQVLGRYRRHSKNITTRGGIGYRRAQSDHLNTIRWMMVEYPEYGREAVISLAETLRQMRWISKETYMSYLKLSLLVKFNLLAFISALTFKISFGKVAL